MSEQLQKRIRRKKEIETVTYPEPEIDRGRITRLLGKATVTLDEIEEVLDETE